MEPNQVELWYPGDEVEAGTGVGAGAGLAGALGMMDIFKSENPLASLRLALSKSLSAGFGTSPDTKTDGGAFRIESLEPILKNLIFNELSTTMANDMLADKVSADNTVLEYATLQDISEAFTYEEGGIPAQEDDRYGRAFELVKFVGAVGQVTNVAMKVKAIVGYMEREKKSKMLAIKRKLNNLLYFGDKTMVSTEFPGFVAAVKNFTPTLTDNIIDMRGKRPTIEIFNQAVNVIENVAGYTNNLRCYMSPTARNYYKAELLTQKRYLVNGARPIGELDNHIDGIGKGRLIYDNGEMPYKVDMFLNPRKYPRRSNDNNAFIASGDKAPAVPTITSVTPTADATSLLDAGTYDYCVVAVNKYGHKSTPQTVNGQGIAIAAGEKAVFVVADGGSASGQTATSYELFRQISTGNDTTDYRYIGTYVATANFSDDGSNLPDTGIMLILEWDREQVAAYHQLMDAAVFPLGSVADAVRWLQRLYGSLLVYNPKRVVILKNVGSIPNA